ncbi:MAG: hypothetical protein ACI82F_003435 [Planctomycetota bacterium]|jgi:hypothetical protein
MTQRSIVWRTLHVEPLRPFERLLVTRVAQLVQLTLRFARKARPSGINSPLPQARKARRSGDR